MVGGLARTFDMERRYFFAPNIPILYQLQECHVYTYAMFTLNSFDNQERNCKNGFPSFKTQIFSLQF